MFSQTRYAGEKIASFHLTFAARHIHVSNILAIKVQSQEAVFMVVFTQFNKTHLVKPT